MRKSLFFLFLFSVLPTLANNPIDQFVGERLGKKIIIKPADDRLFIRRIWLDLTGRVPTPDQADQFLANQSPEKRAAIIDSLMSSEAFNLRWTVFFEDIFQNRQLFENPKARNEFQAMLHKAVSQGTPLDELARSILTGRAAGAENPFMFWAHIPVEGGYRLDNLDDQIAYVTETMLGVQTLCISCHDGAYHLEEVNVELAKRTRREFWQMAAFLSKSALYVADPGVFENDDDDEVIEALDYVDMDGPDYNPFRGFALLEEEFQDGEYHAQSQPGDGMRPPRSGGTVQPAYLFTGEQPRPGEPRRQALARLLTADRQFARNMVNRVWAHFFGEGFVEPLDSWDMARIDDATATANQSTIQARTPQLMEYLTDQFIAGGFNLRSLVRIIVTSDLYQWDYLNAPDMSPEPMAYWRGPNRARRLEAEAILEAMFQTLAMPRRYVINGRPTATVASTWALPGDDSPSLDALVEFTEDGYRFTVPPQSLGYANEDEYFFMQYVTMDLLSQLGRGDAFNAVKRDNSGSVTNSLLLMNNYTLNFWVDELRFAPAVFQVTNAFDRDQITADTLVDGLFRNILFRDPTAGERARFLQHLQQNEPDMAVPDLYWVLFNHPDFLYR